MIAADRLQALVLEVALELPATERYDFAEGWEAIRVRGKWFAMLSELDGKPIVNLKADPDDGEALRQAHEDILPGYHMNKRHWITLRPGESIDEQLVTELVRTSYLLVVLGLPKKDRPVDPETFNV